MKGEMRRERKEKSGKGAVIPFDNVSLSGARAGPKEEENEIANQPKKILPRPQIYDGGEGGEGLGTQVRFVKETAKGDTNQSGRPKVLPSPISRKPIFHDET